MLLTIIFAIVFIVGIKTIWAVITGFLENMDDDLRVERYWNRYVDYFENKGKQLAEKRNRRIKK